MKRETRLRKRGPIRRFHSVVAHVASLAVLVAAVGMGASAIVEAIAGGPHTGTLLACTALIGIPSTAVWAVTTPPDRITAAAVYPAVFGSWVALSVAATVPYLLTGTFTSFADALFESISGFTTTGATVLRPIEAASAGILFFRAATQWIGGIGVVVLAVSVLPFLGVGGMELMAAEAPGPSSERLAPRVRESAKRLVLLYLGFTAVVATLYALFGMSPYDAVTHSFTTVSTGGFSPHSRSFAHFDSGALEWIAIVAMFLAASSFVLIWRALRGKPLVLIRSAEFVAFTAIMAVISGFAVVWNLDELGLTHASVRHAIFTTVSLGSTTGFVVVDYDAWPGAVELLFVFAMGLGGMAGSTAGGFKIFRLLTVLSYGRRQLFRQLHPRAVSIVRFGRDVIPEEIVTRVVGFFGLFMAIGGVATLAVSMFGSDLRTSIAAGASAIGNVGPALGAVGPVHDYLNLHVGARTILAFTMLIGRLEIFPVILGLIPAARFIADRLPRRVAQVLVRAGRG